MSFIGQVDYDIKYKNITFYINNFIIQIKLRYLLNNIT